MKIAWDPRNYTIDKSKQTKVQFYWTFWDLRLGLGLTWELEFGQGLVNYSEKQYQNFYVEGGFPWLFKNPFGLQRIVELNVQKKEKRMEWQRQGKNTPKFKSGKLICLEKWLWLNIDFKILKNYHLLNKKYYLI